MQPDRVRLLVSVGEDPAQDPERLDEDTRRLVRELADLEVESVELAPGGAAPPGAKVGDVAAIGSLLVTLLPAVVPKLIEFIQAWTMRGAGRAVRIRATAGDRTFDVEFSPETTSPAELQELIAALSRGLDNAGESG